MLLLNMYVAEACQDRSRGPMQEKILEMCHVVDLIENRLNSFIANPS